MNEVIMTLDEVAEYLKIKKKTLYNLVQQGKLPGFKVGGAWRFKREDIDLWIEERKRDTPRRRED
ncbi:MAG: helix-turn-helix domain-containing protein [Armatimonadetes bacterium]|nr:helix-turn-helix domain-containing protein [Armatimonadota bacterium]